MPIWYTFYTFICLREQIFKNSIAREASFQEALALAERREVEKKGSILPLPHQAYVSHVTSFLSFLMELSRIFSFDILSYRVTSLRLRSSLMS